MAEQCNLLQGVCVLHNAITTYLYQGKFQDPDLTSLLKTAGGVKVIPYDAQASETATALVTMSRETLELKSRQSLAHSSQQSSFTFGLNLAIVISTQSYFLTEKLGTELLQYIAAISNMLPAYNLYVGGLSLSKTQNNLEASPNYFINTITLNCSIPQAVWKNESSDDILSTLRLNIKFDGQNILST